MILKTHYIIFFIFISLAVVFLLFLIAYYIRQLYVTSIKMKEIKEEEKAKKRK